VKEEAEEARIREDAQEAEGDLGLAIALSAADDALQTLFQRRQGPATDACDTISFDVAWKMALNDSLTHARELSRIVDGVLARIPKQICNDAGELTYLKEADVRTLRAWLLEEQSEQSGSSRQEASQT